MKQPSNPRLLTQQLDMQPQKPLLPNEVYGVMQPLIRLTASRGGKVPSSLPVIELRDIDPDPVRAQQLLDGFRKNLPLSLKENRAGMLNFVEEWEEPPLSTEMAIMGRKMNNTKQELVRAIRSIGEGIAK